MITMTKNKSRNVTDPTVERVKIKDFSAMAWVMNNLSEQEILTLDTMPFDGVRFSEFMEKCVDNGLDVKIGWDTYAKSYQVSAMGNWQGFQNVGIACSARGLDIFDAFKILWYKIDVIALWDLTQFVDISGTRSKRG